MDRTFDHYFFVFLFLGFLFLRKPNVFFEMNENTGLNRKSRYERENAETRYKPLEIMLFPSVFFILFFFFEVYLLFSNGFSSPRQTLFKTLCLMTDI